LIDRLNGPRTSAQPRSRSQPSAAANSAAKTSGSSSAPTYTITRNNDFQVENGLDFNSPPRQYQAAVKFRF